MPGPSSQENNYLSALRHPAVWRKALPIGLSVGLLQAVVNQGDHWLHGEVTPGVILKTFLSPLITVSVALASAAATHLNREKNSSLP